MLLTMNVLVAFSEEELVNFLKSRKDSFDILVISKSYSISEVVLNDNKKRFKRVVIVEDVEDKRLVEEYNKIFSNFWVDINDAYNFIVKPYISIVLYLEEILIKDNFRLHLVGDNYYGSFCSVFGSKNVECPKNVITNISGIMNGLLSNNYQNKIQVVTYGLSGGWKIKLRLFVLPVVLFLIDIRKRGRKGNRKGEAISPHPKYLVLVRSRHQFSFFDKLISQKEVNKEDFCFLVKEMISGNGDLIKKVESKYEVLDSSLKFSMRLKILFNSIYKNFKNLYGGFNNEVINFRGKKIFIPRDSFIIESNHSYSIRCLQKEIENAVEKFNVSVFLSPEMVSRYSILENEVLKEKSIPRVAFQTSIIKDTFWPTFPNAERFYAATEENRIKLEKNSVNINGEIFFSNLYYKEITSIKSIPSNELEVLYATQPHEIGNNIRIIESIIGNEKVSRVVLRIHPRDSVRNYCKFHGLDNVEFDLGDDDVLSIIDKYNIVVSRNSTVLEEVIKQGVVALSVLLSDFDRTITSEWFCNSNNQCNSINELQDKISLIKEVQYEQYKCFESYYLSENSTSITSVLSFKDVK